MPYDVDIAIIGGGPAGATLARLLDHRLRVVLFDLKSDSLDSFRKACGGLLSADAQRVLAGSGLTLPRSVLADPQIFSVRTLDIETRLERTYQRTYINMDRHAFDRWLLGLIPDDVDKRLARVTGLRRTDDGWLLDYRSLGEDSGRRRLHARIVVGADGAASLLRRQLYPDLHTRRYTALQQWFVEEHERLFYSCLFDQPDTDCYSWSISKDGYFVLGGAYPILGAAGALDREKEKLRHLGFHFSDPVKTEGCVVLRPSRMRDFTCGHSDAFLIGEAAGLISSSSLEGISSALLSGQLLARQLNRELQRNKIDDPDFYSQVLDGYRRATRPLRLKLLMKIQKDRVLSQPMLRSLILKTGVFALKLDLK